MPITFEQFQQQLSQIEEKLGYRFQDRSHLVQAFAHPSFVNENQRVVKEPNERLEFLGDSVLGLIIADWLYQTLPDEREGVLSSLRSALVEAETCAHFATKLSLEHYLLLGKGEWRSSERGRRSILADLFEAVVAAIFLDGGFEAARVFVMKHFHGELEGHVRAPKTNWKAELQDYCQKKFQETPVYEVLQESGPDHSKQFDVAVMIQGKSIGTGMGSSKKQAESQAAREALEWLKQN